MWLLGAAMVLAFLKILAYLHVVDVAGVSAMPWWGIVTGFVLSAAWFFYADHSGITSRKALAQMEKRKQQRRQKQRERLGVQRKR